MTNKIEIRPVKHEDNAELAKIIRSVLTEFGANIKGTAFYDAETDAIAEAYEAKNAKYYVALINGKIVGGGGVSPLQKGKKDICELQKMYLLPEVRGKKIGLSILLKCLDFAKNNGFTSCYLETFPTMKGAISFYEKLGFKRLKEQLVQSCHEACHIWMLKTL